jgi:hypothetical protein
VSAKGESLGGGLFLGLPRKIHGPSGKAEGQARSRRERRTAPGFPPHPAPPDGRDSGAPPPGVAPGRAGAAQN